MSKLSIRPRPRLTLGVRARRGISLAEILVAITLLAIFLSMVGRLSMTVNGYNRTNDIRAKRGFAMQQQMNFIGALPYASLTSTVLPASKSFTTGDFSYTRRVALTTAGTVTTIAVTIVPATGIASDTLLTESMKIVRTNPPCGTVLRTC